MTQTLTDIIERGLVVVGRFGPTTVARARNSAELKLLLDAPCFRAKTVIVKPNWVSTDPADFTDAAALRMLFEALDGRIVVTESYCLLRSMNLLEEGPSFTLDGRQVNWRWLVKGDGWQWLTHHPGWDWFRQGDHWEQLRREDQEFLDKYGFSELFQEFGVTYVNVTEEVWSGRAADPGLVRERVNDCFRPLQAEKLYGVVPQKLFELSGATFISFARLKMYASFTMKNMFGLIPDPLRPYWHGPGSRLISRHIVDINKVYHALFDVVGLCEALTKTAVVDADGEFEGTYVGRYDVGPASGTVVFGRDLLALDALLLELTDPERRWIADAVNRQPLKEAEAEFGPLDHQQLAKAKATIGNL